MKFEEIKPFLRQGKKIRHSGNAEGCFLRLSGGQLVNHRGMRFDMSWEMMEEETWEVVEETPKLRKMVFKKWCREIGNKPMYTRWINEEIEIKSPEWKPVCDAGGTQYTKEEFVQE